ncbi:hypothetical protein ON010_g17698 [Phytophthora cinnamomi]|nr:hypothetical protein ON010_g17698 [Phytophthora cinnamomi]
MYRTVNHGFAAADQIYCMGVFILMFFLRRKNSEFAIKLYRTGTFYERCSELVVYDGEGGRRHGRARGAPERPGAAAGPRALPGAHAVPGHGQVPGREQLQEVPERAQRAKQRVHVADAHQLLLRRAERAPARGAGPLLAVLHRAALHAGRDAAGDERRQLGERQEPAERPPPAVPAAEVALEPGPPVPQVRHGELGDAGRDPQRQRGGPS